MEIVALFLLGLALIVKGGDWFLYGAVWIAETTGVPRFIIGATIVSLATTLPELTVSVTGVLSGEVDLAVGNAVGSVTANTALIMAVAMLAMHIVCQRKQYLKQCLLLIAAAAVLLVFCLSGRLSVVGSILLGIIFILFMAQNIYSARQKEEIKEERQPVDKKLMIKNLIFFVVGAAAIVIGSQLMVDNGGELALRLGVPERVVAVTLIAVGTSLPELVTTITAIVKKESALSVGNIIGANIIDLSLILPICSLVSGEALPVSAQSIAVDLPACLLVTLLAIVPLILREKAAKWQGALLLAAYVVYLVLVL